MSLLPDYIKKSLYCSGDMALLKFGDLKLVSKISQKVFEIGA